MADHPDTKFFDSGEFLRGKGLNWTSQFGEDGYISVAFERIGVRNCWCFEVGAADGVFYSNTKRLRDIGWNAVLIESDYDQFQKLRAFVSEKVSVHRDTVGPDDLDEILSIAGAPTDIDLGIIDIDGQDFYVWQGMTEFKPRLMLVEFSPYGSPNDLPALNAPGQAGLNPILELGKRKGYLPLVQTFCNVLFVREDAWKK